MHAVHKVHANYIEVEARELCDSERIPDKKHVQIMQAAGYSPATVSTKLVSRDFTDLFSCTAFETKCFFAVKMLEFQCPHMKFEIACKFGEVCSECTHDALATNVCPLAFRTECNVVMAFRRKDTFRQYPQ